MNPVRKGLRVRRGELNTFLDCIISGAAGIPRWHDRRPRIRSHGFDTIQPDPPHFRFPRLIVRADDACVHSS